MKRIAQYSLAIAVSLLIIASCDKGLKDLNTNKTSPTSIDPVLLLNIAIITFR